MNIYYKTGSYCQDVACRDYAEMISLKGYDYALLKEIICRKCQAWNFYQWLHNHNYIILKRFFTPECLKYGIEALGIEAHPLRDLDEREAVQFYCKVSRVFKELGELNEKETIAFSRLLGMRS